MHRQTIQLLNPLFTPIQKSSAKIGTENKSKCHCSWQCVVPGEYGNKSEKKDKQSVNEMLKAQVPMQRFATPEEIADSVIFLSSDRAKFITGITFTIDGGQTTVYMALDDLFFFEG